ncbi:hypothetical protein SANTM175S_09815 [Streptomyces antimycoticus]
MNVPVLLPRSDSGSTPACSMASQDASRASRCCGAIPRASRGLMPKNVASNPAGSSMKPPSRV